jgi:hypothetical protein
MSYTSEDVTRVKEEYQAESRLEDRDQFLRYVAWLRENKEYLQRNRQYEQRG